MTVAVSIEVGLLSLTVVEVVVANIEAQTLERLKLKTEGEQGWSVFAHAGAIDKLVDSCEVACLLNGRAVGHVHLGAELILEGEVYPLILHVETYDRAYAEAVLVALQIYTIIILGKLT